MISEAFGKETILSTSTMQNNLRFPGQYYDQETALHYNFFRDYDPNTGRYSEGDPIGLRGGDNLFIYPQNPILDYDFWGLLKYTSKIIQEELHGDSKNPQALGIAQYANLSLAAKCTQTDCGKWTLDEFIANTDILVKIPRAGSPRYSGDCSHLWVTNAEYQHVIDLLMGIAESRKQLQEVENRLKGIEYSSQVLCEATSIVEGQPSYFDPLAKALADTDRWDSSGRHTCNSEK